MADTTIGVQHEVKFKRESVEDFASRVEEGVNRALKSLGLDKFTPTAVKTGTGSGDVVKTGVAAGLAAGGVVGLLGMITDTLQDLPIITGIMKLLKLIILLLFMPLIPILKPVLLALAQMAKDLSKIVIPKSEPEKAGAMAGGITGSILGFISGGFIGAAIGAFVGSLFGAMLPKALQGLENIGVVLSAWLDKFFSLFGVDMNAVREKIVGFFQNVQDIIAKIKSALFMFIFEGLNSAITTPIDVGMFLLMKILTTWNWVLDFATKAWEALKAAGIWTFDWAKNIWDSIKSAATWAFDWVGKIWESVKGGIKSLAGGKSEDSSKKDKNEDKNSGKEKPGLLGSLWNKVTGAGDFVVSPGGIIQTDPNDFIIGTKNPGSLGGNQTFNINIDRPQVSSMNDIKTLVKAIQMELYKEQRRYNSYT